MTALTYEELKTELDMHYGSMTYYKANPFSNIVITDGVKYFCDKYSCYLVYPKGKQQPLAVPCVIR